ncbi:DUF58 domain-containing protein [Ornithinicoccus halotolerans]|uniref:DUF58 domain-containing protein n=1 Tax=Ornithinicoccus halotolerans TaxID=1748220 RepID=UPI001297A606|nr:DUF58 domain-containing protein [Ornithinicoccus halotolerans]
MALTGRAVLLLAAGVLPVLAFPAAATVRWWLLLWAVLVVADLLLAPDPRRLELVREDVALQVRLGEAVDTVLLVTNPGRRGVHGVLRDAWQPAAGATGERHALHLPGGERRRLVTSLRPTRRGDRLADRVTVRARGPLGLTARQRSRPVPGRVRALAPFRSRRHLPGRLARLREIDGRAAVRTRGQGTEFDSLRDYVEGDDVRSIDWRATARRRSVVVRTWQPERDRRVLLVLDTSRTSAGRVGDEPRLDAALDAALLLGTLASRAGDRVDLLAGDRTVRARVGSGTGRSALLHEMVTATATLEPALLEADWTTLAGAVTSLTRRRSLVVLLTGLEPAALEEGLLPVLPALTAHHRVVVASVADPELARLRADLSGPEAVYTAAAAERVTALRQRTAAALGRMGVTVLDEPPDRLPPALADHYLSLKAHGLL